MSQFLQLRGVGNQRFVSAANWAEELAFTQNDFH